MESLNFLKGKDRLAKVFTTESHGHIYRFIGHIIQRILVFFHLFLHLAPVIAIMIRNPSTTGTRLNNPQSQSNTNNSTKRPQGLQWHWLCQEADERDRFSVAALDSLTILRSFPLPKLSSKPRGNNNMLHGLDTQVCGNANAPKWEPHQPCYVDKHRYNRKQYCHQPLPVRLCACPKFSATSMLP